jgi:hypothetical protein
MTDETNGQAAAPAGGETAATQVVDEPKRIDPEPEAEKPEAKPETPAAEDAGDGAGDDGEEGEGTDEEGKPKRKSRSGSQRAKRREEYLLNELRERERRLEELERQSPKGDGAAKDDAPKEEDFNGDWTAFVAAKAAHEAAKAVGKTLDAREKSELDRRQADAKREREIAHLERIDDAREVIADFDTVMATMKGQFVRDDVIEDIKSSDKSPLLAYHLAKNPNKLHELNSMNPRELAREIGRLEGSLRMPAGKKQTTAPPPPGNLKGGAAPTTALEQVDDMNEFAERLKKDLAKRAGR